ncbi:MAG: hypothetical protein J6S38_02970 [Erysipelotrichaceae bacterium]|nr:hypothetical protein [Erysipelotrichaceae bacterium]
MKIKLNEIIDGMQENDGINTRVFYSTKENKLKYYGEFYDDPDDENEDGEDDLSEDLIILPDRYEINEYRIMENFLETIKDVRTYNCLAIAMQGKGAFRRFKDMAINLGLIEDWYRYRDEKFRKIAIRWCEDNDLEYE